ncbi:hypothetical protein ACFYUY_01460 [Kitasatospora sp. NPDC004745]|uniref:hypothetical protein n=1 Tax=Kitasatospora sp. NPDC004745 TaxID=3364019 RepID=UPI003684B4EC
MFRVGDKVIVVDTDGQSLKTLGRTGTVVQADDTNQLVSVKGLDNPLTEFLLGERAYRPDQLKAA